jgi:GDP-D-mannose dehydratase
MEIPGKTSCDWAPWMCSVTGARREYVGARRLMLQPPEPDDYVVATRGNLAGRTLIEMAPNKGVVPRHSRSFGYEEKQCGS